MIISEKITIAFCFSRQKEAWDLSEKLKEIAPNIEFIVSANIEAFLHTIALKEKVDCFIIEEEFRECSSVQLVEKLKKSYRYKNSVMSVFSPELSSINKKFLELGTDYNFDLNSSLKDVIGNLKKCILKKLAPPIPKNFKILVLDNSFDVLEAMSLHLNELGHTNNDLCQSVREAKKLLSEKKYDFLILDWNLDDGTCIDIFEFLKGPEAVEQNKSALVVVATGRDDVDDIMTLLRYGVKDYIIKPFGFNEFEEKISYALEKYLSDDKK